MALSKPIISFLPHKSPPPEQLLALEIRGGVVKAAVWLINEGQVEIKKTGACLQKENLLLSADEAIAGASSDTESIKKVVFGLPDDWTEQGKILTEKLSALKKLCHELELSPIGFVVISDALIHYFRQLEGTPPTLILIEVGENELTLNLIKAGKSLGLKKQSIHGQVLISELVAKILKEYEEMEILPSRIFLYDGWKDLEKTRQDLLVFPWTQRLPFLHFPKIEILPDDFSVKAVAAAGGAEMGAKLTILPEAVEVSAEEFGFAGQPQTSAKKAESSPAAQKLPSFPKPRLKLPKPDIGDLATKIKKHLPERKNFAQFSASFQNPHQGVFIALFGALFLTLIAAAAYWYLPKAAVSLTVNPKVLTKDLELTAVPGLSEVSIESREIPARLVEVTAAGNKKGVATGKKLVGDKAKGAIVVASVTSGRTFAAGTTLTTDKGLKFSLDSEVKVATGNALLKATEKGNATAADIGPQYNISSGTILNLANFSDEKYLAQADGDFSGGSSREVLVIGKSDQERVLATLSAELSEKAKNEMAAKLNSFEKQIGAVLGVSTTKKKFSKEAGEEGNEVNLELEQSFKSYVYSENEAKDLLASVFGKETPADYQFKSENLKLEIVKTEAGKDGKVKLTVNAEAKLLPKIEALKIRKELLGKTPEAAAKYLKTLSNVSVFKIELSPKLPGFLARLPRVEKNIEVTVGEK